MQSATLDILARLTAELLRARNVDEGLRALTDAALQVTPADHASVRLCEPGDRLRVGARSGVGERTATRSFARGEGVLGWVVANGRAARIGDSARDPRFKALHPDEFPIASVMSVPIIAEGRILGVLSMSASQTNAFDEADETLATLLANTAAQTLRTAELARLAITDSHTLAYNRRHLLPRLDEEMERATRRAEPLSLLLMDLDHFKRVNDEHGHRAGDEVLKRFTELVRDRVRSIDVLVRRGGEEFVLILPATDADSALQVAERVRTGLSEGPLCLSDGTRLNQTVSIGAAQWDGRERAEDLDQRADLAMYEAKRAGRNRTVLAESGQRIHARSARGVARVCLPDGSGDGLPADALSVESVQSYLGGNQRLQRP